MIASRFPDRPFVGAARVLAVAGYAVLTMSAAAEFYTVAHAEHRLREFAALVPILAGVVALHRYRVVALLLFAVAPVVAGLTGAEPTAIWSMTVFGAFLVALRGLPGLLVGAVAVAGNLAGVGLYHHSLSVSGDPAASIAAFAALLGASAGGGIRAHQQYREEVEGRTKAALESREAAVRQGIAEERVRIARDLHDSVGHQIAVVGMHLGAAEIHAEYQPDAVVADLHAARAGVQAVLAETQQILQVLRVGEGAPSAPTPSHERIPELPAALEAAGLRVHAELPDLTRPLPANVSQAAYRITQEALTNAQRYGTGTVSLRIDFTEDATMTIEIVNPQAPGPRTRARSGGNGIVGMRERAQAAGGTLDVSFDDQGFTVRAELPVHA